MEGNNNYGMPIYLNAVSDPAQVENQLQIGRSSVKDTYAQILKDLDEAESLLPDVIEVNKIARASKGAAIALKSRALIRTCVIGQA